jgi:ABC-2 type transport system ATP-binding protein
MDMEFVQQFPGNGVTLLISSHDLNHVTKVYNRIILLEKGKIIYDIQIHENTLKESENYLAVNAK